MTRTITSFATAAILSLSLAGCGILQRPQAPVAMGIDGVACVGQAPATLPDATETHDPAALQGAQAASGKGGLCAGKAFVVREKLRAYRVWDAAKSWTEFGRWWSLEKPQGPRERYQKEYAICPGWSALDRLVSCDIRPGTTIAVGTTQSADCPEGSLPKTAFQQVFVRNDPAAKTLLVENCRDEGVWP